MPRSLPVTPIAPDPYARPLAHDEHVAAARHWESLLDRGLIGRRLHRVSRQPEVARAGVVSR